MPEFSTCHSIYSQRCIIMLEEHMLPWLRKWYVGFGLLGEQGTESIHAHFNTLGRTYRSVPEHIRVSTVNNTAPEHVAATPHIKEENKSKRSNQSRRLTFLSAPCTCTFVFKNLHFQQAGSVEKKKSRSHTRTSWLADYILPLSDPALSQLLKIQSVLFLCQKVTHLKSTFRLQTRVNWLMVGRFSPDLVPPAQQEPEWTAIL